MQGNKLSLATKSGKGKPEVEIHSSSFPGNFPWGAGRWAFIIPGSSNKGKKEAGTEWSTLPASRSTQNPDDVMGFL